MKQIAICIILVLVGFALGYFLCWYNVPYKEVVTYEKGETIRDTIREFIPYVESIPQKPHYPLKESQEKPTIDTTAIINDWIKNKSYNIPLFDNQYGKLDLDATLQYNSLQDIKYSFTPIQKTITKYKEKTFTPFVGANYSSFGYVGIGGGFFYKSVGIELNYITDFDRKGVDIGLKYKF